MINFHCPAIMNNAAIIFIYKSLWFCVDILNSFRYIARSRIAGSYGNSIFNISRNCQTVLQSDYTILHFHQVCMRVLISLNPH